METKKKIFYGWVVVFAGAMLMSTVIGIGWNCFGQFIKPVCADMGYSRQAMSTNMTIFSFSQMFVNFSWGAILKKCSLKKLMRVAVLLFPAAFFCYSIATELWMFYLCSVIVGSTMSMLTTLAFSVILSNWFYEKRGMALGMASMGTGVGGMIFNPVAASLIQSVGWRMTYRILAVVVFIVAATAVYFFVKIRPEEMGLKPLGYDKIKAEGGAAAADNEGQTFGELIKTWRFRLVGLCVCLSTTAIGCMTQCMSPHLSDSGYSTGTAAFMVSLCMAALAIGKMSLGVIYDKLGTRRATLISVTCGFLGLVGMITCRNAFMLPFILIGQCLGSSFGTVGVPVITQNLFGRRDYSTNYGVIAACSSVGGALSPMVNGAVYDSMGSYNPAFTVWACCLILAACVFTRILPKGEKR